jgi:protein-tyrosine phosphatase
MITSSYIDIHTHILPGVDDGSGSMDETRKMLGIALEQGIGTIIATPHYTVGAKNATMEQLLRVRDLVQAEATKLDKDFRILLGNELYYSESIIAALKSKEALTLAGSRYVLVEFSVREDYRRIYKGFGELVRAGYAPILAHVERYQALKKKEHLIAELIELGCYIQMNSNSLIGGMFHTEAAYHRKLLNKGLIHLIASDCHDQELRVPKMKAVAEVMQKKCEEGLTKHILIDNPLKIIENTYI